MYPDAVCLSDIMDFQSAEGNVPCNGQHIFTVCRSMAVFFNMTEGGRHVAEDAPVRRNIKFGAREGNFHVCGCLMLP